MLTLIWLVTEKIPSLYLVTVPTLENQECLIGKAGSKRVSANLHVNLKSSVAKGVHVMQSG
jgi:hypothetical protein